MAANASSVMAMFVVVATVFSLIGVTAAADAPSPAPVSAAGSISPLFGAGLAAALAAFVFGSALKI